MWEKLSLRTRLALSYLVGTALMGSLLTLLVYGYLKFVHLPIDLQLPGDTRVEATIPIEPRVLQLVLVTSLVALLLTTGIAAVIGWFWAGRIITPLRKMRDTSQMIAAGAIDRRLDVGVARDELADVSASFNTMLDSLADLLAAQQRFAASAAHELLTPVASIQTMVDVALLDDLPAEQRQLLMDVRAVNASNAQTVRALLELGEIQAKARELKPVRLDEVCRRVLEKEEERIKAQGLESRVNLEPTLATSHEVLFERAVSNLVRNARVHNEPGGFIELGLRAGQLTIRNSGAEVVNAQQLTEPFYRQEGRAGGKTSGHGLSMAIVASISKALNHPLTLHAREGGGLVVQLDASAALLPLES